MAPLTAADTKSLAYSVLTDAQKHRFEENLELDFSFGLKNLARFRGNVFNQRGAVAAVHGLMPAWDRIVIASLAGGGAFLALALACGIGWHERADDAADEDAEPAAAKERAEPRASVSLGFIVHGLLSLKWRLTRWLVRRRTAISPV